MLLNPASRRSFVVVVFCLAAAPLAAQAKRAAGAKCAMPDTTGEWYAQQRSWLDDSKRAWTNDTLRQRVMRAAGLDPSAQVGVQYGWTTLDTPRDSAGAAILRPMLPRGAVLPTRSLVGAGGTHAVFLLLMRDSTLEDPGMHRLMESGLGEAFEAETAMLEDRTRVRAGRAQIYGTVLKKGADGRFVPLRIEDSSHVDLRRDSAGLPPLKQSVCAAGAGRRER